MDRIQVPQPSTSAAATQRSVATFPDPARAHTRYTGDLSPQDVLAILDLGTLKIRQLQGCIPDREDVMRLVNREKLEHSEEIVYGSIIIPGLHKWTHPYAEMVSIICLE